jgi:uncharacterized protein (DUF1778 family)
MQVQQAQTVKSARVGLRVPSDLKRAWDEAAALEGRCLSDIIIAATTEAVAGIISRNRIISVSPADMEQMVKDLENPPEPSKALIDGARHYKKFMKPAKVAAARALFGLLPSHADLDTAKTERLKQ